MPGEIVSLPSPHGGDDGYVSLSKTPQGRLIRKKILPMNGSFVHPAAPTTKIHVDKRMAQSLVDNFNAGRALVQVPIVNDQNQHVEDPLRNAGEVIDLDYDDTGVYATIDARKYADDFGKTILGASAFMHLNYMDTATGQRVGPTLLHVAATNRPHINGLGDYEDVLKASADNLDEQEILFMSAEGENPNASEQSTYSHEEVDQMPTLDEIKADLKANHGIDVDALQSEAARAAELSGQLDSVNEQLALSGNQQVTVDDLATALVELSATTKTQQDKIDSLEAANQNYIKLSAESEIDGLVRTGRVLPAQRDAMVELKLSNPTLFEQLVPDTAVVKLSEDGVTTHLEPTRTEETEKNVSRYVEAAKKFAK